MSSHANPKRPSHVHFDEPSDAEVPGNGLNPPALPSSSLPAQTQPLHRTEDNQAAGPPDWHIPNYDGNGTNTTPVQRRPSTVPNDPVPPHQNGAIPVSVVDEHRDSDTTLYNANAAPEKIGPAKYKYSASSTSDNPYAPPEMPPLPFHATLPQARRLVNLAEAEDDGMPAAVDETDVDPVPDELTSQQRQERRGVLAHLHHREGTMQFPDDESDDHGSGDSEEEDAKKEMIKAPPRRLFLKQKGSGDSIGSDIFPEKSPIDDPWAQVVDEKGGMKVKSKSKARNYGKDPKDVEFNRVARLPYKLRRKEQKKPIIEHQITCALVFLFGPVSLFVD
jgi:hypothetical protein